MATTKICTKCNCEKEITEFSFRNDTQNYRRQCKKCMSNKNKKYYIENIDKIKEYQENNKASIQERRHKRYVDNSDEIKEKRKQYCRNNPQEIKKQKREYYLKNKETVKAKTKEYYSNNIEDIKIKSKKYRDKNFCILKIKKKEYISKNKEAVKERHRRYMQTEKGKLIAKNLKHKRRIAEKNGGVTTKQLQELYDNIKICYWCGNKLVKNNIHLDHYTPIAKGGKHTISNLVLSCRKCNQRKGAKDPINFAIELGRLL